LFDVVTAFKYRHDMRVPLLVICDYASLSQEGKLNILGVFEQIGTAELPASHPQMYVVLQVEAEPAEKGKPRRLEVVIMDEDGKKIFGLQGPFSIPDDHTGRRSYVGAIFQLVGIKFEKQGTYAVSVLIDSEQRATVPLQVFKVTEGSPA
jgi:hypothetical protein